MFARGERLCLWDGFLRRYNATMAKIARSGVWDGTCNFVWHARESILCVLKRSIVTVSADCRELYFRRSRDREGLRRVDSARWIIG